MKRIVESALNIISVTLIFTMLMVGSGILPDTTSAHLAPFLSIIAYIFAIDYAIRLLMKGRSYAFSSGGKIDLLSFAPELFFSAFVGSSYFAYLRLLRVFKLTHMIVETTKKTRFYKFIHTVVPLSVFAIAFKLFFINLEQQNYWPKTSDFNLTITVLGFCVAVLVGTKLSVAIARFYALEEMVCKAVGTLRVLEVQKECRDDAYLWAQKLKSAILLSDGSAKREIEITALRASTDALVERAVTTGANAPAIAAFSQNAAILLHRMTAATPTTYNQILRFVMVAYVAVLIIATPSPLGLYLAPLVTVVLGVIHFITEDIDNPLDYGPCSLIDVRIGPLEDYVKHRDQKNGTSPKTQKALEA